MQKRKSPDTVGSGPGQQKKAMSQDTSFPAISQDEMQRAVQKAAEGRTGEIRVNCLCQGGQSQKETLGINADTGVFHCHRCNATGNFKKGGGTRTRKPLAEFLWDDSSIVRRHPYCDRKKIQPDQIRVDKHGKWIIPFTDQAGQLQTILFVKPEDCPGESDKFFLSKAKNAGRGVTGAAYRIEGTTDRVYVCEGPATGHSINQATGATVYCVGGKENFKHVAPWVRAKHQEVVVAADNDPSGAGLEAAKKVYQENGLLLAYPGATGQDFNDMAIDAGLDAVKTVLENAQKPGQDTEAAGPRFKLVKLSDVEEKIPQYLIYGLCEVDSLVDIFSDPGHGKTFMAIDISASVAYGKDFHGRSVRQGPVVYIAGEGQNGIKRRFTAWAIRHHVDLDHAPVFLSLMPAGLCDAAQADFVIDAVQSVADEHGNPVLIVLDTVARNFGPGDENSTKDMSGFISSVDKIREKFRPCVLLIHHSGHGDKSRARGAMALKGALDAEYRLEKDKSGVIRVTCTKMKDHQPPEPMAFRLNTVELPFTDDHGNQVTSAILDDAEYQPPACQGKKGRGKWQATSIDILKKIYRDHHKNLESGGYDPSQARVKLDDWRNACYDAGMSREAWRRIKDRLNENSDVFFEHGYVQFTGNNVTF